jgi:AraC-like DNA-binding protein
MYIFKQIKPSVQLTPFIDRFIIWRNSPFDHQKPALLPGTGVEVQLHLASPLTISSLNETMILPASHIVCLRERNFKLHVPTELNTISIRFKAGAFQHFCGIPPHELNDSFLSLKDIWGEDAEQFYENLVLTDDHKKPWILEKYLLNKLQIYRKNDKPVQEAVKGLYYADRLIKIESVAEAVNLGNRQFQRRFLNAVGVSPKAFHKIARFQRTTKELLINRNDKYLLPALEKGYYDQSHFIRDFKKFTGENPERFLCNANFNSNVFARSLN